MSLSLSNKIYQFSGNKVLLIGDLILDKYIFGKLVDSTSEPNIPVIQTTQVSYYLGGAANVAANISGLQGCTDLIGVIGSDESATRLITLLHENNIQISGFKIDDSRPTTTKTRIVIDDRTVMRLDCETVVPVSEYILKDFYEYFIRQIDCVDAVVISDYSKGLFSDDFLKDIIKIATLSKKPIVVDPKGSNFSKYKNATIITPNEKEASIAVNEKITNSDSLIDVGKRLLAQTESDAILITRGENGMVLFRKDKSPEYFLPSVNKIYNVVGAGDTVVSALALGLAAKLNLIDCVCIASHAASLAIAKHGTSVVTFNELRDCLKNVVFNNC